MVLAALAGVPLWAKRRYKHPLGFRVELPDGWNIEESKLGGVLLPPGVKVDPNREDNPEIYTLWSPEDDNSSERAYIQGVREQLKAGNVAVDRGGDLEQFSSPGRGGVIYTFDFLHGPSRVQHRIRVYAMQNRGRSLLVIAQGLRDKLAAREVVLRAIARSVEW